MAKVTMPLMSGSASGKLADCLVFFSWKGINVVRKWMKPTNPRDVDQKIIRQKLAASGRNTAIIATPTTGLLNGSAIYQLIKADTPAGDIWNAHLVRTVMDYVKSDADFTALSAALYGLDSATFTEWETNATGLGFVDITGSAFATTIEAVLQFYMGAYGAYLMELSGATYVYNTNPTNWTDAQILAFANDYTTV